MMEGGLALGMVRNASFADHIFVQELTVQAGDRLFLLTDGLVEARNDAGEEYDYDRFLSAAEKGLLLSPEAHANAIIEEVEQFTGAFIEDDYTLMILEIKRNSYNFPSV
jgi:serine phosphatase RsbU (regulator of sigma subunit)